MTADGEILGGTLGLRSVVRRPTGVLSRSTADGYLVHTGAEVVAVTGMGADLLAQIVDETSVGVLVERHVAVWDGDWADVAPRVLAALRELQRRGAVEVLR